MVASAEYLEIAAVVPIRRHTTWSARSAAGGRAVVVDDEIGGDQDGPHCGSGACLSVEYLLLVSAVVGSVCR